jgi:Arc/MetJ-type ribon-helix-helix transcriptional regulator
MTTQIAIRLPDDLVAFMDKAVRDREAPSRAALARRALERERRRMEGEHDARVYAALKDQPDADDLDELAAWQTGQSLDLD